MPKENEGCYYQIDSPRDPDYASNWITDFDRALSMWYYTHQKVGHIKHDEFIEKHDFIL